MATSRSVNKVILIGNLTRPPVLRKTSNGSVVATIGIATNSAWNDSEGNLVERAEFHSVTAWGKLAEICAQILNTGMLVYIEGKLRTKVFEDSSTGQKRYRTDVRADDMKLLDAKDKQGVGLDEAYKLGENGSNSMDDDISIEAESSEPVSAPNDTETKEDAEDLF